MTHPRIRIKKANIVTLEVDGKYNQDVILFSGAENFEYRVLLGAKSMLSGGLIQSGCPRLIEKVGSTIAAAIGSRADFVALRLW